jgi:hypothetical protein
MLVQVSWDDEHQSILRYNFSPRWTWDDFYDAYYQATDMQASAMHRVDTIFDMRLPYRLPDNALLHLRNMAEKQPENAGYTIIVSTNSFIVSLYTVAIQNHTKIAAYFRLVNTLEQAHDLIAQERELHHVP